MKLINSLFITIQEVVLFEIYLIKILFKIASDFIRILNNPNNISMISSIFYENKLHDNIFVQNSINATIFNTSCLKNNRKGKNFIDGGGTCFVFENIYHVSFEMVSISDSYSEYTTVGVKVIESEVYFIIFLIFFIFLNIFNKI